MHLSAAVVMKNSDTVFETSLYTIEKKYSVRVVSPVLFGDLTEEIALKQLWGPALEGEVSIYVILVKAVHAVKHASH